MIDRIKNWIGFGKQKEARKLRKGAYSEQDVAIDLPKSTEEFKAEIKGMRAGSILLSFNEPDQQGIFQHVKVKIILQNEFGTRVITHQGRILSHITKQEE